MWHYISPVIRHLTEWCIYVHPIIPSTLRTKLLSLSLIINFSTFPSPWEHWKSSVTIGVMTPQMWFVVYQSHIAKISPVFITPVCITTVLHTITITNKCSKNGYKKWINEWESEMVRRTQKSCLKYFFIKLEVLNYVVLFIAIHFPS